MNRTKQTEKKMWFKENWGEGGNKTEMKEKAML